MALVWNRKTLAGLAGSCLLLASCSSPAIVTSEEIPLAKPAVQLENHEASKPTFYALGTVPIPWSEDEPVYRSISVFRQPDNLDELIAATVDQKKPDAKLTRISVAGNAPSPKLVSYVVQKGDTLKTISREHKTTIAEIKRINGLESDDIKPGDQLEIPLVD